MKPRMTLRVTTALGTGTLIAAVPALYQHLFKAGSLPDLSCELILLPGKLFASLFRDKGTASPEFLWRTWLFTWALFSGLTYLVALRILKRPEVVTQSEH